MANNYNANQVPDKSILDINGRQTYMGNGYVCNMTAGTFGTAETVALLIRIPANTNGKSMFLNLIRGNTQTAASAIVKIYINPTVTSATVTTPIVNLRPSTGKVSIATAYSTFAVSANGTLIDTFTVGTSTTAADTSLKIFDSATDVLVTVQASAISTTIQSSLFWYET